MKKFELFLVILLCCVFSACNEKNENKSEIDAKIDEEKVILENYLGECGYFTENQVFDYSNMFDNVYDWGEGVKMPLEKPDNAKVVFEEAGEITGVNLCIENITKTEMCEYVKKQEEQGWSLYITEENSYYLYMDNFRICFSYNDFKEEYNIFCYLGNAVGDRKFTSQNARKIIEEKGLLKDNEIFKDYYVFAIENKSVKEQGYYEFVVETKERKGRREEWLPFYMLTDGEDVFLFEQNLLNMITPSNVNIIENGEKIELVVATTVYDQTWNSYVVGYELKDNQFVKRWEYDWRFYMDIDTTEQVILSKVVDDKIKFYVLEKDRDYDGKGGRRYYWKIKEEYDMEKTLTGPKAF